MKCSLCKSEENVDDRGPYAVCEKCAVEQLECEERNKTGDLLDRSTSELCMQCGLCCVVLSAEVKPSEIQHLAEWSGYLPTKIARVEESPYPGAGRLVLQRPCVFLVGKPTEYVSCRAYTTERPSVCGSYLCKLAVRYQAGLCTLHEALFILRTAVSWKGNLGMFNWSTTEGVDDSDHAIADIVNAKRSLAILDSDDPRSKMIRLALFERLHPRFEFSSDMHEAIFSAILVNHDGKVTALEHFFEPDEMDGWSERDKEIALTTVNQVVGDFRGFFNRRGEPKSPE